MNITYNKAIRDKIPTIIEKSGKKGKIQKLTDEEYLPELEKKLREELDEYYSSRSPEELADLVEIVHRILELRKITLTEFEKLRFNKREERGAFKENYFLIEVLED